MLDEAARAALLETIRSPAFKARVADLGGYSTSRTGQILQPD